MVKQVIWSRTAHNDRIEILDYWMKRNKSSAYSKRLNQVFENTVELISKHPNIGKQTEIEGIRYKVIKDYLLTYRESVQFIEILTIWDSRQDPIKFDSIIKRF
ncbi:MAG: type II toxin-antitoxin system RelE/ParE family toxin [Bacteroidota bacterium]